MNVFGFDHLQFGNLVEGIICLLSFLGEEPNLRLQVL